MSEPSVRTRTSAASNPCSVVSALSDAANYVFGGFQAFFRLSLRFLLFAVGCAALVFAGISIFARSGNEIAVYVLVGTGLLVGFLISSAYYIVVVRNWLFGESDPQFVPFFGRFLIRVAALAVIMLAVMAAIFAPALAIGIGALEFFTGTDETSPPIGLFIIAIIALFAVVLFAVLAGIFVAGRLSPWLVAAAAGAPLTLGGAWHATRGAGIRIAGGMLGLTLIFAVLDLMIEAALSPALGLTSEAFENIATGAALPALFVLLLAKILVYFPQSAASMVYCASIYKQISGG